MIYDAFLKCVTMYSLLFTFRCFEHMCVLCTDRIVQETSGWKSSEKSVRREYRNGRPRDGYPG
jgi:hypothetical protein